MICDLLQYGAAIDALSDMQYGNKVKDDRPFLLGNLQCSTPDETDRYGYGPECHHGQWNNTECKPGHEAVVKCNKPGMQESVIRRWWKCTTKLDWNDD